MLPLPPISILLLIAVTLHTAHIISKDPVLHTASPTPNLEARVRGKLDTVELQNMASNPTESNFRNQLSGERVVDSERRPLLGFDGLC